VNDELEQVEAEGYAVFCGLLGGAAIRVRGGLCLNAPVPIPELNRAADVHDDLDLDAVADVYGDRSYLVSVPPWVTGLDPRLEERGYQRGYAWMKFERGPEPAPAFQTSLRIEEARDAEVFGRTFAEGFGAPPGVTPGFDVLGRPDWHCFLAWDGDEAAGAASLFAPGDVAWFGGAATRPAFRGRGAQTALLAARIERARELGVRRMAVETGERVEGRPHQSYRNILRAGFREAYVRPNWRREP
jgi:GNAT superfamily N-acetyltransferase